MSTNYRLFSKKAPPFRMHMDHNDIHNEFAKALTFYINNQLDSPLVIVCIGTDRSTGDSLGPLIGSKLESFNLKNFYIYGTLQDPIHAVNMHEKIQRIEQLHDRAFIIAIDACLGKMKSVGDITLAHGPVTPGAAVKKDLPPIGDIHITGIVNIGGMMEYFVLQNTRLYMVMTMADVIATSIQQVDQQLSESPELESTFETTLKKRRNLSSAFSFMNTEKFKL
ncbi:spore protease YyaC [Alkalihalobacillus sp. 1P02AB]|uniref:spore protease YyaC n=1 Tax=Alkalihalobacillus sp. 1P02AB TaxID=3132260 RepID=UPI0039A6F0A9